MNTRLATAFSRHTLLAAVAMLSASAALLSAQPAAAAKADPYTQGADRQADTYGYLSWSGDMSYPGDTSRA